MAVVVATVGELPAGALLVPSLVVVESLSPHDAIPLALATVVGAVRALYFRRCSLGLSESSLLVRDSFPVCMERVRCGA